LCGSFPIPKAVQISFAQIMYPSTSYYCVGVKVSETLVFQAGNNITGGSNKGGGWELSLI